MVGPTIHMREGVRIYDTPRVFNNLPFIFGVVSSSNFKVEWFPPLYFVHKHIVPAVTLLVKS